MGPTRSEDKQVKQIQLYTIIKKSGVAENRENCQQPSGRLVIGRSRAPCAPVPAGSQQTCHGFLPALDKAEGGGDPGDDTAELTLLCQELPHIPLKSPQADSMNVS